MDGEVVLRVATRLGTRYDDFRASRASRPVASPGNFSCRDSGFGCSEPGSACLRVLRGATRSKSLPVEAARGAARAPSAKDRGAQLEPRIRVEELGRLSATEIAEIETLCL